MKKSKIYTRTGDLGSTGLVSGTRTLKSDLRIDLYGELDELNSRIGYACSQLNKKIFLSEIKVIHSIQSSLFNLGANMACEFENRIKFNLPQLDEKIIGDLENEIDRMEQILEPLKNFILPGGSVASGAFHLARTGARAAERKLVHYQNVSDEELPNLSIVLLNRLSDYFFVLARYVNKKDGGEEIFWNNKN